MNPLDGLLQSYLDLQRHFDPAAASAAGFVSANARLGGFDAQTMREHLVAFRAIAAAIEDVELDELDDEIDRTALLAEVRGAIARLEQERPHVRDPGFWIGHARQAVASLTARPMPDALAPAALARISALPSFFDAARGTLRRPPVLLVDAALLELGPLGELLVRAAALFGRAAPGGTEAMNAGVSAALEALKRFGAALRDEIEPEADWARGALGLELFERRLQEAYAIRSSAAELARWAEHTLDEIGSAVARGAMQPVSAAPTPIDPLVEAQDEAMKNLPSAVRRTLRSAVAVQGWSLYASGVGREQDPRWLARLRRAAARLAVDVGLHARGMTPAAATELLIGSGGVAAERAAHEVRSMAAAPTGGLAEAAGYREIARLRDAFASREGDDRNAFHAALLRYGALPPGLAGWGMGLQG